MRRHIGEVRVLAVLGCLLTLSTSLSLSNDARGDEQNCSFILHGPQGCEKECAGKCGGRNQQANVNTCWMPPSVPGQSVAQVCGCECACKATSRACGGSDPGPIPTVAPTPWANEVAAPCRRGLNEHGLRSCKDLLGDKGSTKRDLLSQVRSRVQEQIDGYFKLVDNDSIDPPGHFFGPTVCNVVEGGPFTGNATAAGCGQPMKIQAAASTSPRKFTVTFDKRLPNGTLEDGILRGGLVASTSCNFQEIRSELIANKRLDIRQDAAGSACRDFSKDYQALHDRYAEAVRKLAALPGGREDVDKLPDCERRLSTNPCGDGIESETPCNTLIAVEPPSQGFIQMCAARQALEGAFTHLVACETFARSRASFERHTGTADAQVKLLTGIRNTLASACRQECRKLSKDDQRRLDSVERCFNQCYPEKLPKEMKSIMEGLWPASPDQAHTCAAAGGMLGLVPWGRRRRRRRHRHRGSRPSGKAGARAKLLAFVFVALPMMATLLAGCPQSILDLPMETRLVVDAPACPSGIGGQKAECCGSEGDPLIEDQKKQCLRSPGSAPVKVALAHGAELIGTGNKALSAAYDYFDTVSGGKECGRPIKCAPPGNGCSALPPVLDDKGCPIGCGGMSCPAPVDCPMIACMPPEGDWCRQIPVNELVKSKCPTCPQWDCSRKPDRRARIRPNVSATKTPLSD